MLQGFIIFKSTNPYLGSRYGFKRDYVRNYSYKIHDDFPCFFQCKDAMFRLVCDLYDIPIYYKYYGLVLSWLRKKGVCFYYSNGHLGFEYDSVFYKMMSYVDFRNMYDDILIFD